jgi:predicted S18 family serine protease
MSLMTVHNDNAVASGPHAGRAETIACVSVICLLASAPLFVAIGLMIWGG